MAIITPTINKIIRMTEFDLLRTAINQGNMYMCLDSQKLYYDETSNKRVVYYYQGVKTINDLLYNITPSPNTTYYCWEDNSLWLWMNKWITLYSDSTYPSAYVYDDSNNISEVYRYGQPLLPADDNGLLKDGSVVIRDRQRIIKGKIYIDDGNDNFVISSFLGGGVRILPNGQVDTDGEFFIGDEGKSFIRSEFHHYNNETYVDYSENPDADTNPHQNGTHIYKVFHEGNLDASLVKDIKGYEIYTKLLSDKTVPNPMEFNVTKLNGKTDEEFAAVKHNHLSTEIDDFNEASRKQALVQVKETFNNMEGEGITVAFDSASDQLLMSANNFTLSFGGGVTGSQTIEHLGNTTINLVVDPTKHRHSDYLESIDSLQQQVNELSKIDHNDFYKKDEVDLLIEDVAGTSEPTPGKPLLVNENGILPITSETTNRLTEKRQISFIGDVTGTTSTDFSADIEISLNTDNVISVTPEAGKAVKVNSEGDLPVNATSASQLNHNINVTLTGEVSGTAVLDTSKDAFSIDTILVPGDNVLQTKDLGVTVASLNEDGIVPTEQLPPEKLSLYPQGYFTPSEGYPNTDVKEGQFWIADSDGTIDNILYEAGDWCIYLNTQWNHISNKENVYSVNGYVGNVVLGPNDVKSISTEYVDYTLGDIIPANKVVMTSENGVIAGASVTNLTNEFEVLADETGDILISTDSINTSTDGTKDLNLKLMITPDGYNNIIDNAGLTLYNYETELPHRPNLKFGSGIDVQLNENDVTLTIDTGMQTVTTLYWNDENIDSVISSILKLYPARADKAIQVLTYHEGYYIGYLIDGSYPDEAPGLTINVEPSQIIYTSTLDKSIASINANLHRLKITFADYDADTEEAYIIDMHVDTSVDKLAYNYITTDAPTDAEPFIPTSDAQPTSKKYVDDKVNQKQNKLTAGSHIVLQDDIISVDDSNLGKVDDVLVNGVSVVEDKIAKIVIQESAPFTQTIGNGKDTSITVTHNLNTRDFVVQLYDTTTYQDIIADVVRTTVNTITINFLTAPTTNQYRVVIRK